MHRLCQEIKCVMGIRGQWKVKLDGNLISMYLNLLHGDQGNYTQNRTTYKGDTVINNPQQAPYCRKYNGCNMVDSKTYSHARCDISGVSHFLEISANGNGKIKKDVVKNIKYCHERF